MLRKRSYIFCQKRFFDPGHRAWCVGLWENFQHGHREPASHDGEATDHGYRAAWLTGLISVIKRPEAEGSFDGWRLKV